MPASDMQHLTPRHLTPGDVEARLPLLVRIADDIVEAWTTRRIVRERRRAAGRGRTSESAGETRSGGAARATTAELARLDLDAREEERRLTELLAALGTEVEQLGGTLLDPSVGVLEFPGIVEGRLVMLSWRRGEERVAFYRSLDAPRGDRTLLPGAEAPLESDLEAPPEDGDRPPGEWVTDLEGS